MATKGERDYRPKMHFAPKAGWINDPNGLVKRGDTYHLFAQYYPNDTVWGPMHWLHATSEDLVRWNEIGVALEPDELGFIFSGGALVDEAGRAGFGKNALIVMYASHGECEQQSIAYSTDGINFTKHPGNPVIKNPGLKDFRDPNPFINPVLNCFSVVIAAGDRVAFYKSNDMVNWERTGEFGKEENRLGTVFECPDLFPLKAPDGRTVWALTASMICPPEEGGSRPQYFLGEFDGYTFRQTEVYDEPVLLDAGYDNYAPITFFGTEEPIMLGWGNSWTYAAQEPTGEYCGVMTLARRVSLKNTKAGLRIAQMPVIQMGKESPIQSGGALPGDVFALKIKSHGVFSAALYNKKGERFEFGLNEGGMFFTDRSCSGEMAFNDLYNSPLYQHTNAKRLMDGPVELLVVFDRSIIEIFADNGLYANATLMYPTSPYEYLELTGAEAMIMELRD